MATIVLGIDPGIADTGYGVIEIEKNNLNCLEFGSIKTSPQETFSARLLKLEQELQRLVDKYKPNLASVEKLFFNSNVKTAMTVSQARGIALLVIERNNIKLVEFTPLQIKQSVCNFGRADKNQVKKMVKLILNIKEQIKSDDSADALAAAICASTCRFN